MTLATRPESDALRLFCKMSSLKMTVGKPSTSADGKQFLTVNGYTLTVQQLLEIESTRELTSWGVTDYVEKHKPRR
jgi:hypothetical protein